MCTSQRVRAGARPALACSVDMLGQVAVRVVVRLTLVGEPAVRPDLGRAEYLPADAQDDTDRLVVEDQRQACHERRSHVAGYTSQEAKDLPRDRSCNVLTCNV